MILGIGTDIVEVNRFQHWQNYPIGQLEKVFTAQELDDCRSNDGTLNPQKLAARFAAKEAFYKGLSSTLVTLNLNKKEFSLLSTCPHVAITYGPWGVPHLQINWPALSELAAVAIPALSCYLSFSHEKSMAVAFVVIESKK